MTSVKSSITRVDDIESGCDLSFERRWWSIQRVCWVILTVLLLCGVAGLLGNGPLSSTTTNPPGSEVEIRYDRLARRETPAIMELHLQKKALASGTVRVQLNGEMVNQLRIKTIVPTPLATELVGDGARFTFKTDPTHDSATVVFIQDPTRPGLFEGEVTVEGAEPVHFRQFVYP